MRDTILEALKDDMIEYIKSSRSPYNSDIAKCVRGIHGYDEVINKPFIGISLERDTVDQEIFDSTGTDQIRRMVVYIYCYMDNSFEDYTKLHTMIDDVEYFLKYNFTYKDNTYIKDITIIEGGVSSPIPFFDMYIEIVYNIET